MEAYYNGVRYEETSRPPIIRFELTVKNNSQNRIKLFGFKGRLTYFISPDNKEKILLDYITSPIQEVLDLPGNASQDIYLNFVLTPFKKNVIEDTRQGDLQFQIYLYCYKIELSQAGKSVQDITRVDCWVHTRERLDITIPRSRWADMLSEGGYDKKQIIELPLDYGGIIGYSKSLSKKSLQSRLSKASEQLEKVIRKMDEGRWREAVGDCRVIIEMLTKGSFKDDDGETISAEKAINNTLKRSGFPEKNINSFRTLIQQLSNFSSLTHHITVNGKDVEEAVPMDREDALFTVTTLTTIINLLSRKFQKQIVS